MKKLKPSKAFIVCILVIILTFGLVYSYAQRTFIFKLRSFSHAKKSCGVNPIIGSKSLDGSMKFMLTPSDTDNDLLSKYDTATASDEKYKSSEFFCSADQAVAHGYESHKCCGFLPSQSR